MPQISARAVYREVSHWRGELLAPGCLVPGHCVSWEFWRFPAGASARRQSPFLRQRLPCALYWQSVALPQQAEEKGPRSISQSRLLVNLEQSGCKLIIGTKPNSFFILLCSGKLHLPFIMKFVIASSSSSSFWIYSILYNSASICLSFKFKVVHTIVLSWNKFNCI